MPEYTFTLILNRDPDPHLDELYEAGCDDATFGAVDSTHYAEFTRDAPSIADAITSAIADVQRVDDLRVVRVEPDDLVTASEIAQRLGRTRESVRLLISGQRGARDFPAPISHTRQRHRLWRWADILDWAAAHNEPRAAAADVADARLVAAINAALELDSRLPELSDDQRVVVAGLALPALR